jgi:CheY-like chemotaxis protein
MRSRVLIVEDNPLVRGFLEYALADEGYEVRTAENGRAALTVLDGWKPELILLDLKMPVMDGREFRRRQLDDADLACIPTVLLSTAVELEREAGRLGAAAALSKPCDIDRLLQTVAALIAASPSG